MASPWLTATQFAAAGLFLVLAVVMLAVKFNSRLNRAFAIFLLLRGVTFLLQIAGRLPSQADNSVLLFDIARYFVLATPFVLLYFAVLFLTPLGGTRVRVAGILAILLIVIVEALYLADHCLTSCTANGGRSGALTPVTAAIPLAEGLVAMVLAREARRQGPSPTTRAVTIAGSAFTILALAEGTQGIASILEQGLDVFVGKGWLALARLLLAAGFATGLVAFVSLLRTITHLRGRVMLVTASLVVVTTTTLSLYFETTSAPQALTISNTFFGAWRLLVASLVAYALLRHHFLDLDLRINWTISRGTVVAILAATFLVVFQVVENALDQTFGIVVGGVVTGLMLLAIKPLERLGDRIASSLHPRGRLDRLDKAQREALFREQAEMVWADGVIGRKERLLLDNLRERLGITAEVALRIEGRASRDSALPRRPNGLSNQP